MKPRGRVGTFAALACLLAGIAAGEAAAGSRIVNGLTTQDFPTTGALLYSESTSLAINQDNASTWCSGTLIGCQTFLTAAHCIHGDAAASHYWVFLQHGGIFTVSSIIENPSYNPDMSGRDMAIVKLSSPVTGIDPTTINSTHDLQALGAGQTGTIAGFGRTGGTSDYGIKRYGDIVTSSCNPADTGGEGDDALVCWNYDATVGAPGEDSNTCNGDSGGPLFMDFSGSEELAAVTSAGTSTDCQPVDHSWDASVYYNRVWIAAQIGADSTASCGTIPPVGDVDVTVTPNSGTLNTSNTSDAFEIHVPAGAQLARFTLNALDVGFNPNFFVRAGSGASASLYDCKSDGAASFGACEFASPTAGTWSVFVQRGSGGGLYQLTTTVFGGTPPVCGNDLKESGEDCDGTDLGICAIGPCSACHCPAPVCGNNATESGEICDGSDDAACPGLCQGDCSCDLPCSSGDLYGLSIRSDPARFGYKAELFDPLGDYQALDPRDTAFTLLVSDGSGEVSLVVPGSDPNWIKADPVARKYGWKGDGTNDGLRRIKLRYNDGGDVPHWILSVRGRDVTGAGSVDVGQTLDFRLGFDGTCHTETW